MTVCKSRSPQWSGSGRSAAGGAASGAGRVTKTLGHVRLTLTHSNFHTVVINLRILRNFQNFVVFSGRFGPRGGRKRILLEKSLPKVGSRLESVPWGPVSWPFSVFAKFSTSITTWARNLSRGLGNAQRYFEHLPVFGQAGRQS